MADLIFPRRRFLQGLFAAPAIIALDRLMPVKARAEVLEPKFLVPAVNYGLYVMTWSEVENCFTTQLNNEASSQMFPVVEMTAKEMKILANVEREFAVQAEKDLAIIKNIKRSWAV
jgi:hypothetical protein